MSLVKQMGKILGSLQPRSAELILVHPNPLETCPVLGNSSTRMHSGFSICSRMSYTMRSPVLIWMGVSQLLIRRTWIGPW